MARSVRIEYSGAFYHVMARGNRRERIFFDDEDRHFFLEALGQACARPRDGVATIFIYHGWKPIAEWDESVPEYFRAWNVYGPGADEILLRHSAKYGYTRYHSDPHGNVKFLFDNDGAVVEKYTYDVFGRPKITDAYGNPRASSHYDNRFLFQGRDYIGEVGVYDYRNRFYHPALGRFLQKDPTGFDAGDMNLFRYCGDDPVDLRDPTGLVNPYADRLIITGGGDWIGRADGISYRDAALISAARIQDHINAFERQMNINRPGGDAVKWKATHTSWVLSLI